MKVFARIVLGIILAFPAAAVASSGGTSTPESKVTAPLQVDKQAQDTKPQLLLAYQPIYPREHLLAGKPGSASVVFTINSAGRVVSPHLEEASHPLFGKAVMSVIPYWEYLPAKRFGTVSPVKVRQKFTFKPSVDSYFSAEFYDLAKRPIPVLPIVGPRPLYPATLRGKNLRGYADVILTVNPLGKVTQSRLGDFTHKDFGQPALDAAGQWEFRPFDPSLRYEQETGTKPVFLTPNYGSYQVKLTLLFHPESSNRPPFDLRRVQ
ncbi:MAG: TonB family protein [Candidatus Methylacidiphilales bacterium]|nr:TonB family protein [Candidatus Methylacidiphilales bacterium]